MNLDTLHLQCTHEGRRINLMFPTFKYEDQIFLSYQTGEEESLT